MIRAPQVDLKYVGVIKDTYVATLSESDAMNLKLQDGSVACKNTKWLLASSRTIAQTLGNSLLISLNRFPFEGPVIRPSHKAGRLPVGLGALALSKGLQGLLVVIVNHEDDSGGK